MNFVKRKLTDLRQYENNPRHNGEAVGKVKRSIQKYGYKVPIVIDENNFIVAGHTRFAALIDLDDRQYDEIYCVMADDLDENQVKQFRIVDNQVGALAGWDFVKLSIELNDITDFMLDEFGDIPGFEDDVVLQEATMPETTDQIIFKIGSTKIMLTEAEYHDWANYVTQKGISIEQFVRQNLELDRRARQYPGIDV